MKNSFGAITHGRCELCFTISYLDDNNICINHEEKMNKLNSSELVAERAETHLKCLGYSERQEVDAYINGLVSEAKNKGLKEAPIHQFIQSMIKNMSDIAVGILFILCAAAFCFGIGAIFNWCGKEISVSNARFEVSQSYNYKITELQKEYNTKLEESERKLNDSEAANSAIMKLCSKDKIE